MAKRVAVGMSGGVDSSVAAALLVEQGYEVTGVFIEAYNEPGCRTDEDKRDALKVASRLGIRFQILDFRKEYKEKVVKYFEDEYRVGRTPNPDVVCNREVKFGLFYDWALKQNFDYVATGHYARINYVNPYSRKSVNPLLQRPKDLGKDQTYWLWQVEREKLEHILFPLGELTKKEVRSKAHELKLLNADKPDSMGVCMMGELNVREWLKERLGENPGEVVWKGKLIGHHRGLWFATVGQRGGWEVLPEKQTATMPALYVVGKNMKRNQLIMGQREECYVNKFQISDTKIFKRDTKLWVRIRNLGELVAVKKLNGEEVTTEQKVFAPAEGQSAVFYDKEGIVVGGGIVGSCN